MLKTFATAGLVAAIVTAPLAFMPMTATAQLSTAQEKAYTAALRLATNQYMSCTATARKTLKRAALTSAINQCQSTENAARRNAHALMLTTIKSAEMKRGN